MGRRDRRDRRPERTPEEREERRSVRRSALRLIGRGVVGAVRVGLVVLEAITTIAGRGRSNTPKDP